MNRALVDPGEWRAARYVVWTLRLLSVGMVLWLLFW